MNLSNIANLSYLPISDDEQKVFTTDKGDLIQYGYKYFKGWSKRVKDAYNYDISKIIKEIYKAYVSPDDGRIYDIHPLPNTNYSFLNYLTSHYTAVMIMVNFVNIKILEGIYDGKPIAPRQIIFDHSKENWEQEMHKMFLVINKSLKYDMFLEGSIVFDRLKEAIFRSNRIGYDSESKMVDFLKKLSKNIINIVVGGHGVKSDMVGGIDITFDYKGRTFTDQHKKCSYVDFDEQSNNYFVKGVSNVSKYTTHYLSFEDNKGEIYMFKNKNVIVDNNKGIFIIPSVNILKVKK